MNNELKDILSNSNKDIDNQQLMDYLSHHVTQADSHHIEKSMAEDPFVNDAVEGLQQFKPTKDLQLYVEQLNSDLQKQIVKNKKRKDKRKIKNQPNTYFAILLILLLLIISYIIIKRNYTLKHGITKTIAEQYTVRLTAQK
jgi:hypothetical protein